ncbi:MAG TPA: hypothetical protein VGQ48_10375, partial [Gemmatimonadales bacterium]|nr:hypothetical protein [Gemmatimonadales bacterium]
DELHDLLRRVGHRVAGGELEARGVERGLAGSDVVALEANNERELQANFLDIGGSSNPDKVVAALKIITADPNVRAILFNIFGGITRTDDVANGIVTATKQNPLKVPIVIRLTGTNEEIAMKILTENGFTASSDMDEAVQRAVQLATSGATPSPHASLRAGSARGLQS